LSHGAIGKMNELYEKRVGASLSEGPRGKKPRVPRAGWERAEPRGRGTTRKENAARGPRAGARRTPTRHLSTLSRGTRGVGGTCDGPVSRARPSECSENDALFLQLYAALGRKTGGVRAAEGHARVTRGATDYPPRRGSARSGVAVMPEMYWPQ
jgi:hypothetical protein